MNNNIKKEVIITSISLTEIISLSALSSDDLAEKIVALDLIRNFVNRVANICNKDFTHSQASFYEGLPISLLEMSIVNLRNLAEELCDGDVDGYIYDSDEVFDMLDRWEQKNER